MGGARDVARDEDAVGHHPMDVESAAAGVAGHAPEAGGEPSPLQPFSVADRPERRQHHVDVEHAPVGEAGPPHVSARVAFQRLDGDPEAQVDPVVPLHLSGDPADHTAKRANERRLSALSDRHGEVELATDRGNLRADKAGADDQDPPRPGCQRRLQLRRVIARAQREHPVQRGLRRVEPGPRAGAGRDQQAVERDLVAIGEAHLLAGPIQTGSGHAEPPLRIDRPQARQLGMVGRHPPLQHLLREGGAIVWLVRLIPDDGQGTAEALVAQGFGSAEPCQGGADDDDPAVSLKVLYQSRYQGRDAHDVVPSSVASHRSTRIACTGQDAAARSTRWRCASSGLGSYMSASSPCSWKTSGASGTHCAYPRHRFRSTTIRILPLLLRLLPPTLASPRGGWSGAPSMLQPAWPAAVLSTLARGGASCLKTYRLSSTVITLHVALTFSQVVVGRPWCTCARGDLDAAGRLARDGRAYRAELCSASARVDALQTAGKLANNVHVSLRS